MRWLRSIVVLTLVGAFIGVGPAALAAWNKSSGGDGRSGAITMPAGNTPWTSVANRNVTVSWTAVTMPGGVPVDGYKVFRYDAGGTAFPITGSCTGVIAGLTCTETAMPPGSWNYSVAPVYELWQGAEGPRSSAAVVAAPALNLTGSTDITSVPGTLDGTVSNYIPGQTLTMRLDDPTSGEVLTATVTPSSIPAGGGATVQVTVPNTIADGSHTLYAVGSTGDTASAAFTVNAPALTPTNLALINGGTQTGRIEAGDSLQVTYSQPLSVASLCNGASGDGQTQTLTGTVTITNDNGIGGHDLLAVGTPSCAGGPKFGSISLGHDGFVNSPQQFNATITYTPANRRITVVLGTRITTGQPPMRVNQSVTATYTPDPALTATNGRLITGTVSSTGVQF